MVIPIHGEDDITIISIGRGLIFLWCHIRMRRFPAWKTKPFLGQRVETAPLPFYVSSMVVVSICSGYGGSVCVYIVHGRYYCSVSSQSTGKYRVWYEQKDKTTIADI